jgi:hypothetical protein
LEKWLVSAEKHFGGFVKGIKKRKVSPKDPRRYDVAMAVKMQGGDRMAFHGYAGKYAQYLTPVLVGYVLNGKPLTIVEVGILKGTGLAVWADLFPKCRLIGLDIDLSFFVENRDFLKKCGAFKSTKAELYEFDQYANNSQLMRKILNGSGIDICVDDGTHANEPILRTFESMRPYLASRFIYFIEDNADVHKYIKKRFTDFNVESAGELTIITPKLV